MTSLKDVTLALRWQVVERAGAYFIREFVNEADAIEFGPLPDNVTPQAMIRERMHMARTLPIAWRRLQVDEREPAGGPAPTCFEPPPEMARVA